MWGDSPNICLYVFVGHGAVTDRCGDVLGEWREEETTCAPWGLSGHVPVTWVGVRGQGCQGCWRSWRGVTENLNK